MSTYQEAEAYILNIPRFSQKNTLADLRELLKKITSKNRAGKVIHIAGTNGKGSVCAYLRSVLMEGGCSVGMFTSPHLVTMRERIRYNGALITEREFVETFDKVRELSCQAEHHPSFFEFLFLMAMDYFCEKDPEYIILETGLGGRLDATNCLENPRLCVITEIGFDHMQYLGDTIEQIAAEKAGIIKPGVPVVVLDKRKEATRIIEDFAGKQKSPAIVLKKEDILDLNIKNKSIDFSLQSGYYNYITLSLHTRAVYQVENAALAVRALELLEDERIRPEVIRKGIFSTRWPGRMEEILPSVYLDGAHNEDGIEALLETAGHISCEGRRLLLFGVASDKRYPEMIRRIVQSGLFQQAAITTFASDRSASLDKLRDIWGQYNSDICCSFHENTEEAYAYLMSEKKDADIVYIAGSLYLAGQIKALIRREPDDRF